MLKRASASIGEQISSALGGSSSAVRKRNGWLVAFSVTLGKPSAKQIRFFNGSLIVTAPRSVHEALGGPVD